MYHEDNDSLDGLREITRQSQKMAQVQECKDRPRKRRGG
jgi:hypothetical protein